MGKLIAFCGIDGSGKTTQIHLLEQYLAIHSINYITVKQPSNFYRENHHVRKKIDENNENCSLFFLALLSAADRMLQQFQIIGPALEAGNIVIMDRYVYSAYAYMKARGINDEVWLRNINKFAIKPDVVFYIDIEPSFALDRIINRDGISKKKEEQHLETMKKVRDNFINLCGEFPIIKIDGELDKIDIHKTILNIIDLAVC